MKIASNKGVIADASIPAGHARMSKDEWREAIKFGSTDTDWVIMSIGMVIDAGIVFLPVQVGLMRLWVFLLLSVIGYPTMYPFQRLFINMLTESPGCKDYPSVISDYLGKNWGILLGALYFVMLVIWMFIYSIAIANDDTSYLHIFGVTEGLLSNSPFYGLVLICILVTISSRDEKLLFKVSTGMVLTRLLMIAALSVSMVGMWHLYNVDPLPPLGLPVRNAVITLPFTLTSTLFIQTLSPMVISYRSRGKSIEVARHKVLWATNIMFSILFVIVLFYAVSFTLTVGHDEAVKAYEQNISALVIATQFINGDGTVWVKVVSVILNIFAVVTAFFGVYLDFCEATQGIVMSTLRHKAPAEKINENLVQRGIMIFAILLAWSAIVPNASVLSFTSICSPIFGVVGCLIPAWLIYKVPALHKYEGVSLYLIIVTSLLLCASPFLTFSWSTWNFEVFNMFDSTLNPLWQHYILAVQEKIKPVLRCTKPVSLALAVTIATAELEGPIERVEAWVSPNLMENGLGVTVPGTGMVGLSIAAALEALGRNANAGLEVLKDAAVQAIADAKALLAAGKISVKIQEPYDEILFSRTKVWSGEKWACVAIAGGHTDIVHTETHDGVAFTQQACVAEGEQEPPLTVLPRMALAEILKFVSEAPFATIHFILDPAKLNCALSQKGLSGGWGLYIGATLEKQCERDLLAKDPSPSIVIRTSATSDTRVSGATLSAMSSSSSGNQGITAAIPVVVVAEHFGADGERLTHALMLSRLSAVYVHNQLPRLSTLCATTTAAMGTAAGMAWLADGRYETIPVATSSMIGGISDMICDGMSNSCTTKVSTSASATWRAMLMALDGAAVTDSGGIVAHDVEQSIANLCALVSHSI